MTKIPIKDKSGLGYLELELWGLFEIWNLEF